MDPSNAFVMVPCTTRLRGTYHFHVQDPHEPTGSDFDVKCRVHAIGHRDVDIKATSGNFPDRAGTWYLVTTKELKLAQSPRWIHEDDGHLKLDF